MTTLLVEPTGRVPRGLCRLSRAERDAILPYKAEYKNCTTKEERQAVYRGHIGPAIFEYWRAHNLQPAEGAESIARSKVFRSVLNMVAVLIRGKAVAEWLTNNWRPKVTTAREASGTISVSYLDIMYRRYGSKIDQLVQQQFNVQEFSWSDQPYFGQRLPIIKEAYDSLTEAEKEDVQQELKKVKEQGWDAETQKMYVSLPSHPVPLCPISVPLCPAMLC